MQNLKQLLRWLRQNMRKSIPSKHMLWKSKIVEPKKT